MTTPVGVPYHCKACEVGWTGDVDMPTRCDICGEFGERGGVAEKVLWAPNRSIIEQEKAEVRDLYRRYPYLGNRIY